MSNVTTTKAIVVYLTDGNDLYVRDFETREEALDFIESIEWKSQLITGENLAYEDHT